MDCCYSPHFAPGFVTKLLLLSAVSLRYTTGPFETVRKTIYVISQTAYETEVKLCFVKLNNGDPYGVRTRECLRERQVC